MADPLVQISNLARSAEQHAREIAGIELAWDDLSVIDRLLDAARHQIRGEPVDMLATCYGAWFGQQCAARL